MCFFAGHPWKLHSILLLKFDMLQPPSAGGAMKYSNLDGSLDLDGQPVSKYQPFEECQHFSANLREKDS